MTLDTPAPSPSRPKSDEKIMAALSHGSILLPIWGLIASILIWLFQKDKSPYVRFQALQAIVFQVGLILAFVIGFGCYFCTFFVNFGSMFMFASSDPSNNPAFPLFFGTFFLPFGVMGLIFLVSFIFIVYGIVGAVITVQGKDFRYILIGDRVERFLGQD